MLDNFESKALTEEMKLLKNFPYFSQLDNRNNPHGSCNVTSVAMCLAYFGIKGDGSQPQLEDQMYKRCIDRGWSRHSPYGLKALVESYGFVDDFTEKGTLADIRKAIDENKPCIVHGYFTRSGHIVTICGYDDQGFIVNDPYGEAFFDGKSYYYDTNRSGKQLHYSTKMISVLCSPESVSKPNNIFLHRISKK